MAKIGIDLDVTLNHFMEHWLHKYNIEYGDTLKPENITDWDITKFVRPTAKQGIYDIIAASGFYEGVEPREGIESIEWLTKRHEVYIVTAYLAPMLEAKVKWVKKHLPFIDEKNIIFINNKHLMRLDVLIDDGLHNFGANHAVRIMFETPGNIKNEGCFTSCLHHYSMKSWVDAGPLIDTIMNVNGLI